MKLREGMNVCVSVKALYEMDGDLLYGRIAHTGDDYFDLYNEDGELACMDGEEVMIAQVGQVLVTFRNDNGEGSIYFTLTHEECETAVI